MKYYLRSVNCQYDNDCLYLLLEMKSINCCASINSFWRLYFFSNKISCCVVSSFRSRRSLVNIRKYTYIYIYLHIYIYVIWSFRPGAPPRLSLKTTLR